METVKWHLAFNKKVHFVFPSFSLLGYIITYQ